MVEHGEERTAHAFRCHWQRVAREISIYLREKNRLQKKRLSGYTDGEIAVLTDRAYRDAIGTKTAGGEFNRGPSFKHHEAAEFLKGHPRFEDYRSTEVAGVTTAAGNIGAHVIEEDQVQPEGTGGLAGEGVQDPNNADEIGNDGVTVFTNGSTAAPIELDDDDSACLELSDGRTSVRKARPKGRAAVKREKETEKRDEFRKAAMENLTLVRKDSQESTTAFKEALGVIQKNSTLNSDCILLSVIEKGTPQYAQLLDRIIRMRGV